MEVAPTTAAGVRFAEAVAEHGQLAHQTLVAEEIQPSLGSRMAETFLIFFVTKHLAAGC